MSINDLLDDVRTDEDGVKRDQYGRYLIPDPDTGEIKAWTRVTTLSGILDDTTALETWKMRNIIRGLGMREDLFALAASVAGATEIEDKKTLDNVIATAEEVGGGNVKSNLGTAMHGFTQRLDLGENGVEVPSQWSEDIAAYLRALKEYGLWTFENYVEKVVIIPALNAAGTLDRLLMGDGFENPRVADLKTGKVDGKSRAFATQEAEYAHATHVWDPKAKTLAPMPEVDQERGLIIHLPIGEGRCEIWETDLVKGWEYAQLAVDVHTARKDKSCCWPFSKWEDWEDPAPALTPVPDEQPAANDDEAVAKVVKGFGPETADVDLLDLRKAWIRSRVEAIVNEHKAGDALAAEWNITAPDVPTFGKGGPGSHEEIELLAKACSLVEKANTLPFFDGDPADNQKPQTKLMKELLPT